VLLALLAVTGIYMALPKELIVGPTWLLPALVVVLLVPTVFAHRTGRHSLNHLLGIVIGAIITFGLIASVVLLVTTLPGGKEPPLALLLSGGALWLTNVLCLRSGIGGWTAVVRGNVKRNMSSEAAALFFRRCKSKKLSARPLGLIDGAPDLWTIFSSPSPPVQRSARRMRRS
jgi:hypothetical protein